MNVPAPALHELTARAECVGLAVRGAFHPAEDDELLLPAGRGIGTFVLLGFTGSVQWPRFLASSEARDGLPDPLDRWSRRVIGALALEYSAAAAYPSGTPWLPFQRLAVRCEVVHSSPIGLLIHGRWGLWHAYRGALLLPSRIELDSPERGASPCAACAGRPCLTTCPVDAFRGDGFDVSACVTHVGSEAGLECRERGCLARRACPVGAEFRYLDDQARFHTRAFLRTVAPPR